MPGASQTDGEGVERHWASLGPIATSTREMGPGHRQDTIDDHLGGWNWTKISQMGEILRKRRRDARLQSEIHGQELLEFQCGGNQLMFDEWLQMVKDWEMRDGDNSVKNPYSLPRKPD
ncbi:hypothetical protein MPER_06281 [Moniliophthora perniciosa FA553]|nr:hypothetical protein MPER_06281 [Moniliophthora perniciosa FA553]